MPQDKPEQYPGFGTIEGEPPGASGYADTPEGEVARWRDEEIARLKTLVTGPQSERYFHPPKAPYSEGIHPVPEWVRATMERLAVREMRLGRPHAELGPMADFVERSLGYTPGYWEDPRRIARWHNVIKAQPPGQALPDWLPAEQVQSAYTYLKARNNGAPWTQWKWLNAADPARQFLQSIPLPPGELMFPDEQYYRPSEQPQQASAWADPNLPAPGTSEWEALPRWQKILIPIIGSGTIAGAAASGGFFGGAIGLGVSLGNPAVGLLGAGLGAVIGGGSAGALEQLERRRTGEGDIFGSTSPGALDPWLENALMDLLGALQWPAEQLERGIGLSRQLAGSLLFDEERYGPVSEVFENLPAAWRAGSVTFEQLGGGVLAPNILERISAVVEGREPVVADAGTQVWVLGKPEPVPIEGVPDEYPLAMWSAALVEGRRRIMEGNEAPDSVVADISGRYGLGGQLQNLYGQVVLDPLNFLPLAETEAIGLAGRFGRAAAAAPGARTKAFLSAPVELGQIKTAAEALQIAARMARQPLEQTGAIKTLRLYGNILRGYVPREQIGAGRAFTRWLGGVTKAGEPRVVSGELPGVLSIIDPRRWFGLTPRARAYEILGVTSDTVKTLMDSAGDPLEVGKLWRSVASTPGEVAQNLSLRFLEAPDGHVTVMAMRDFDVGVLRTLETEWISTQQHRAILEGISQLTGEEPMTVLKALESESDRPGFFKRIRDLAEAQSAEDQNAALVSQMIEQGQLTDRTLAQLFNLFIDEGASWHPEHWKARLYDAWMDHVAGWAIDRLGVKVEPMVYRVTEVLKAAQGLALLDINPGYFLANFANNMGTMLIDGSFGIKTLKQTLKYWQEFGMQPFRLRQSFGGPAGIVGEGGITKLIEGISEGLTKDELASLADVAATQRISKAGRGTDGLEQARQWVQALRSRVGITSKAAAKVEAWNSHNAFTRGTQQWMARSWQRGVGFRRMPPGLEEAMTPFLDRVYGFVESQINVDKLRAGLLEDAMLAYTPEAAARQVARSMGMDPQDVGEVMQAAGASDFLKANLEGAKSAADVRRVFALLDGHVRQFIDTLATAEYAHRVSETAAQIKAGDWTGFIDTWYHYNRRMDEWWTQHVLSWSDAIDEAAELHRADPDAADAVYASRMANAETEATRIQDFERATIDGMVRALRESGIREPELQRYTLGLRLNQARNREFFSLRDNRWRTYFAEMKANVEHTRTYTEIVRELDGEFSRLALDSLHTQEVMDLAIVELLSRTNVEAAERMAVVLEGVREHRAGMMAREQNVRRVMYDVFMADKPTGRSVARMIRQHFGEDLDFVGRLSTWLDELGRDTGLMNKQQVLAVRRRLYAEYLNQSKLPGIKEYHELRTKGITEILGGPRQRPLAEEMPEPARVRIKDIQDEQVAAREAELVESGVDPGEARRVASEEAQQAGVEIQQQRDVTAESLRKLAADAGIGTATREGNAYDGHLLNVINKDLGLTGTGFELKSLDDLLATNTEQGPLWKLAEQQLRARAARHQAYIQESRQVGLSVEALTTLDDGPESLGVRKLRRIAGENGLDEAQLLDHEQLWNWLSARRGRLPTDGYEAMTPGRLRETLRTFLSEGRETEAQLDAIMRLYENWAASEGLSLNEWAAKYMGLDDGLAAETYYMARGVDHPTTQRAIELFGRTEDPERGFFLLRDGTYLDGANFEARTMDTGFPFLEHLEVGRAVDGNVSFESHDSFLVETGSARFRRIGRNLIAEFHSRPSVEQMAELNRLAQSTDNVIMSLHAKDGRQLASFNGSRPDIPELSAWWGEVDGLSPSRLYQDGSNRMAGWNMEHDYVQRAVETFGLTDDPMEAGYLLRDGSLLDFSGKIEGGPAGTRSMDHRQIGAVIDDWESWEVGSSSPYMNRFMHQTGAARWGMVSDGSLFIEVAGRLSPEQLDTIRTVILTHEPGYLDFDVAKLNSYEVVHPRTFENPSVDDVVEINSLARRGGFDALYQEASGPARPFYSWLTRVVDAKMPNRIAPDELLNLLNNAGVKADELYWTGFEDWVKAQEGPVSKDAALAYLSANEVQIREVTLSGPHGVETRYERYTMPGGENYREMLFTLPARARVQSAPEIGDVQWSHSGLDGPGRVIKASETTVVLEFESGARQHFAPWDLYHGPRDYQSPHWDDPNVLAHVRMKDRTLPDGRRVLFIEEVQSDWFQALREAGEPHVRLPDAPFSKTWHELVMRRMLRMAAEEGYDGVGWHNAEGQFQAETGQPFGGAADTGPVEFQWTPAVEGELGVLAVVDWNGNTVTRRVAEGEARHIVETATDQPNAFDVVMQAGPDGAEFAARSQGRFVEMFRGLEGFYDKIIPDYVRKYVKRWGAELTSEQFDFAGQDRLGVIERVPELGEAHYLPIADEMRNSVIYEGQRLFQFEGEQRIRQRFTRRMVSLRSAMREAQLPDAVAQRLVDGDIRTVLQEYTAEIPQPVWEAYHAMREALNEVRAIDNQAGLEGFGQPGDQGRLFQQQELPGMRDQIALEMRLESVRDLLAQDLLRMGLATDESIVSLLGRLEQETVWSVLTGEGVAAAPSQLDRLLPTAFELKDVLDQLAHLRDTGRPRPRMIDDSGSTIRYRQGPKGMTLIREDGRAVIRALSNPDFSTAIHESAHVFRRSLVPSEMGVVVDWLGSEGLRLEGHLEGRFLGTDTNVRRAEEAFARGFERYLAEGVAPSEGMKAVFAKMKEWLYQVYKAIVGSDIDVPLNDRMRELFASRLEEVDRSAVDSYIDMRQRATAKGRPVEADPRSDLHVWHQMKREALEQAASTSDATARLMAVEQVVKRFEGMKKAGWVTDNILEAQIRAEARAELRAAEGLTGLEGAGTAAHGPDPNVTYEFRYRVMELDDVIASHDLQGNPTKNYPRYLQPRDRSRSASVRQSQQMAAQLNPDALLLPTRRLDDGAPIVGSDALVESGNGRIVALQIAREQYPQAIGDYKARLGELLRTQPDTYGQIDMAQVEQMSTPVLVRERLTDVNRGEFAKIANESAVAGLSVAEQAQVDVTRLTLDALQNFTVQEGQNTHQALQANYNRGFVQSFVDQLPRSEIGTVVDAEGALSVAGMDRLLAAMFARVYGGEAGIRLAQLVLESPDPGITNIADGMMRAAGDMAKAEALVQTGRRPAELGIGQDVAAAVEKLATLKAQGAHVDDYVQQLDLFGRDLTDFQVALLQNFENLKRSPNAVRDLLSEYARRVVVQADTAQTGLFGAVEYPTKAELWEVSKQSPKGQDQFFQLPPDVEMGAPDSVPPSLFQSEVVQDGWDNIRPVMEGVRDLMASPDGWTSDVGFDDVRTRLTPEQQGEFRQWASDIEGDLASTKYGAVKWGESTRDWSLLNYNARRGIDEPLSGLMPYFFWPSRTFLRWMLRTVDKPSLMANYARLNEIQRQNENSAGFPSRLRGKIRIPLPFLPDWMGGALWVDPLRNWFPPHMFIRSTDWLVQQQRREVRRAAYIIEQWVANGDTDPQVARDAITQQGNETWRRALDQARLEDEGEFNDPLDYLELLAGMSLPLNIAKEFAAGTPEHIGPLPVTRLARTLTAPLGIDWGPFGGVGGLNLEAPIRRAAGLPEYDRFEDYRVDRMLSNMAAENPANVRELTIAMNEERGPAYDEAVHRVGVARLLGTYGSPLYWLGFPADSYPAGEQAQRSLTTEFREARAARDAGDATALRRFFEKYPEYGTRLDLYKDPQQRMRFFLIDEVWTKYMELGSSNKELARLQLGTDFQDAFLNKETRNYDDIPLEALAVWANRLGGLVPQNAKNRIELPEDLPALGQLPAEAADQIDTFRRERNEKYPNWFAVQQEYFRLPPGEQRRTHAKRRWPWTLEDYWDWRRKYLKERPFLESYYKRFDLETSQGESLTGGAGLRVPDILTNPILMRQLGAQRFAGQQLTTGALEELMRIWKMMGKPTDSLDEFIEQVEIGPEQQPEQQGGY